MTLMKRVGFCVALILVLGIASASGAEMTSANYKIPTDVISGGGTSMTSAGYKMESTLGQSSPLVVNAGGSSSVSYVNYPGFWQADWGLWDADGDSLSNNSELGYNTDPFNADTDGDGLNDYIEAVIVACLDPLVFDTDGDGLSDGTTLGEDQNNNGIVDPGVETDPCNPDSDGDGLNDGYEVFGGLNPLSWDSDGDFMPDGYEVNNATGHSAGENLDPLDPADGGTTDYDTDTNTNVHEYWNNTDPWTWNPVCGEGCFCWGDAGGDGTPDPTDIVELAKAVRGLGPDYSNVLPTSGLGQDLDADGALSPVDITELKKMVRGLSTVGMVSRPGTLVVLESPGSTVKVGDTCHVTVGVEFAADSYSPAFGVIFKIGAGSVGSAEILGGEGASAPGRYDVSEDAGTARVFLKILSGGTVEVEAGLPGCGVATVGRYCPVINAPVVEIKTQ